MFTDSYDPYMSGVTSTISLYREYLEHMGHDVLVFTYGGRAAAPRPGVVRSPGFTWLGTGYQLGYPLSREAVTMGRTVDIAHVHQPFLTGMRTLSLSRRQTLFPVVFTCHSRYADQAEQYARAVPGPLRRRYVRDYMRWFCGKVAVTIAPSATVLEWLHDLGITERVVHLPNAIDTEPFNRAGASRVPPPGSEAVFRCCFLGRLAQEKNVALLLRAFARFARRVPAKLTIVGDGPLRAALERQVSEEGSSDVIEFAGRIPRSDVPALLACQHCLVTTSTSEGLPLSLIEAMAAGAPVIGVRAPGISDLVEPGVSGLLADATPEAFADALAAAAEPELWERLSEGAVRKSATFAVDRVGPRLLELYARAKARAV